MQEIKDTLRSYILVEFLPGEQPDALTDSTPLITGGILDSIATLKLVTFLEQQFRIELQPHETDPDFLDTIDNIATLVQSKM